MCKCFAHKTEAQCSAASPCPRPPPKSSLYTLHCYSSCPLSFLNSFPQFWAPLCMKTLLLTRSSEFPPGGPHYFPDESRKPNVCIYTLLFRRLAHIPCLFPKNTQSHI